MRSTKCLVTGVAITFFFLAGCIRNRGNYPEELSDKAAAICIDSFKMRKETSFALSYTIDLSVIRKMGGRVSSLYVGHGITEDSMKVLILMPVDDEGKMIAEGQYFIEGDRDICPPTCDASFTNATPISRDTAEKYIQIFQQAGVDKVNGFIISHTTINALSRNASVRNLKVYNALGAGTRCVVVKGVGAKGEDIKTSYYLLSESLLCPPGCAGN